MTPEKMRSTNVAVVVEDWDTILWKPRFFVIWSGQALSLIGSALTQFVLVWWITQTTGSPSALATAGIMAMVPQALFGPLGGTFADRWNRRIIMIVADLITASCMLVLILLFATAHVALWHVYTLMFLRSTMQAFQSPAAQASTGMLVPPSWLTRAAGMNQTVQGLMSVAAAPLGAAALGIFPFQGALLIDVVTALVGITPLLFYRIPQPPRTDTAQRGVWHNFRQGLHLLSGHRGLLLLYSLTMLMVGVLMPAYMVVPLLVRDEFGGGVTEVALMESLGGIGMLLGGVFVSTIALPWRRINVVLISFVLSCTAIALTGLVPRDMFWLAVVCWGISGIPYTIGSAPMMAIIQTIVPNQLQGRALSLLSTLMGIAGPIGLAFSAPLGGLVGARGLLLIGGGMSVLVCLMGLLSPSLMRIEEQPIEIDVSRHTTTIGEG